MKTETIIERLENALGCLNGSMIDNCTPKNQFESLLNDLKQVKNNDLLHSVSGSAIDVLKQMAECPNTVDSATIPKAGIETAPEQVVVNLSVNYTKYKRLLEVVKHYS